MSWVDTAIADFGRSIGLPDLAPDASGTVWFAVEQDMQLVIDRGDDFDEREIIIRLQGPAPDAASTRALLRASDFRRASSWQLQVTMQGDALALALRVPRRYFALDVLEAAIRTLIALRESTGRNAE